MSSEQELVNKLCALTESGELKWAASVWDKNGKPIWWRATIHGDDSEEIWVNLRCARSLLWGPEINFWPLKEPRFDVKGRKRLAPLLRLVAERTRDQIKPSSSERLRNMVDSLG